jgi:3-isopropylmalate/(R)-2-methylmalate dehydratase small subunit
MSAMRGKDESSLSFAGRAWVFGNEVNTDDMFPGFALTMPVAEAACHMFNASRPGWVDEVRAGDIVVGGRNFGIGSSRPVPLLFKHLGVAGVLAEQFNSLFLRNCINYGLPALTVTGIRNGVTEGQELAVDVGAATVVNNSTGQTFRGTSYPDFIHSILVHGGVLARLEREGLLEKPRETV